VVDEPAFRPDVLQLRSPALRTPKTVTKTSLYQGTNYPAYIATPSQGSDAIPSTPQTLASPFVRHARMRSRLADDQNPS
jgi:hypothetical protein